MGANAGAKDGMLKGSVQDLSSRIPLKNALVSLDNGAYSATVSDGRFQIMGITPGSHVLRVESTGYVPLEQEILVNAGDQLGLVIGMAVP